MKKILLMEDDKTLNATLKFNLQKAGYVVTSSFTIKETGTLITQKFDLAILDVNLPDGFGYSICTQIKQCYKDTAIIFLTANDMEIDIIKGYSLGASDYITKPFSLDVFLVKIKAIFAMLSPNLENLYDDGFLKINFTTYTASLGNDTLILTPMEYNLISVFVKNKNQVLTRNRLLQILWDDDNNFVDEHALTATISRIRKKIEINHTYVKTIYGVGYVCQGTNNE